MDKQKLIQELFDSHDLSKDTVLALVNIVNAHQEGNNTLKATKEISATEFAVDYFGKTQRRVYTQHSKNGQPIEAELLLEVIAQDCAKDYNLLRGLIRFTMATMNMVG